VVIKTRKNFLVTDRLKFFQRIEEQEYETQADNELGDFWGMIFTV
jgi:hypothetical protein